MMVNKRILTINDWKNKKSNENVVLLKEDKQLDLEIKNVIDYALALNLPKIQTEDYIKTIFTDITKAPEEISANFVKDNLDNIITTLDKVPESKWPKDTDFLSLQEMILQKEPKEWMAFKINENLIQNFVKTNVSSNYIYNNGIIYIPNVLDINESFFTELENNKAYILFNNAKWIKNIIKK